MPGLQVIGQGESMKKKVKALGLFSGGLDSQLAFKLLKDQGIEVIALNFTSPFCNCGRGGCSTVDAAERLGVPIKTMAKGEDFIKIVRDPPHGHGSGVNPCIDCRIYILKKAKEYAKEIGADFIFTGEVKDQRPMSQHFKALHEVEKESGLEGKLLRPLSAKLLPPTEAEKEGLVDREKLMGMQGRRRIPQMELAKKINVKDYPCPAGGCLLTEKEYAAKAFDLFEHQKKVSGREMVLLKYGRHFRKGKNKIIVGRNEEENKMLSSLKGEEDVMLEVEGYSGPITLLQGPKTASAVKLAASLTVRYASGPEGEECEVKFGVKDFEKSMMAEALEEETVKKLMIKRK
jgi:tRNA U34 2-thiouridine synthase MnmA/TrmU